MKTQDITKKIIELYRTEFKNSLAPARAIAWTLKNDLNVLGINEEDHLIFILNRID